MVADVFHARCVILTMSVIHLSLHKSTTKVLGMSSPKMKNEFTLCCQIRKCWYGRHPWIRLAMESESMVEKGINFIFYLGTAYDISRMESIGNYSIVFVDRKSMQPKMFISTLFLV